MAMLKFLGVACASPFFLLFVSAVRTGDLEITIGTENRCLVAIDVARQNAGLPQFMESATGLPDASLAGYWKNVCKAIGSPVAVQPYPEGETEDATYALLPVEDPSKVDCLAVVRQFQAAIASFPKGPPPKSQAEELYNQQTTQNFFALYNPKENSTAECKVITCKFGQDGDPESHTNHALFCETKPEVSLKDGVFTRRQWKKIAGAIGSSAQTAVPAVLMFAAVAVGALLL